jgi:hypothetical protein
VSSKTTRIVIVVVLAGQGRASVSLASHVRCIRCA